MYPHTDFFFNDTKPPNFNTTLELKWFIFNLVFTITPSFSKEYIKLKPQLFISIAPDLRPELYPRTMNLKTV